MDLWPTERPDQFADITAERTIFSFLRKTMEQKLSCKRHSGNAKDKIQCAVFNYSPFQNATFTFFLRPLLPER